MSDYDRDHQDAREAWNIREDNQAMLNSKGKKSLRPAIMVDHAALDAAAAKLLEAYRKNAKG